MKRGLCLAPFDELADPRLLAKLGRAAESVGWDGVFLLGPDRLPAPGTRRGRPWVALTSIDPQPPQPEVRAVVDAGP